MPCLSWEILVSWTDPIRRLDVLLSEALGRGPLRRGLREQEALAEWPKIVGSGVADHSRAIALQDGILLVQVESSVWAQELSLLKPRIQQALNERLGSDRVKDVRFRSGRLSKFSQ